MITETYKIPISEEGKTTKIITIIRDVTERKKAEQELQQRENDLAQQARNLEELNTALKVLLKKREEDKTELEEKVLLNIKELVLPYLDKIRKSGLDESQHAYADILESHLREIVSSFSYWLSSAFLNLTPAEINVANLVRQGKTNKEIAVLLNVSSRTAAFHRERIRKKLGITNQKTNLKCLPVLNQLSADSLLQAGPDPSSVFTPSRVALGVVPHADHDRVLALRDLDRRVAHVADPGHADPSRPRRPRRVGDPLDVPCRGETAEGGVPEYQSKRTVLARGPTTATERTFVRSSGRSPAEFLRRTIDFRVTSGTRARVSGCAQGSERKAPAVNAHPVQASP